MLQRSGVNDSVKVVVRSGVNMSFTQADGVSLQHQVATLLQQMNALMTQNSAITRAFDDFRQTGTQEINMIKSTAGAGRAGLDTSIKLMDVKDFKPQIFTGLRDQAYKPWRKLFLTYANLQCQGFRKTLEWIEKQETEIDDAVITQLAWAKSGAANP